MQGYILAKKKKKHKKNTTLSYHIYSQSTTNDTSYIPSNVSTSNILHPQHTLKSHSHSITIQPRLPVPFLFSGDREEGFLIAEFEGGWGRGRGGAQPWDNCFDCMVGSLGR